MVDPSTERLSGTGATRWLVVAAVCAWGCIGFYLFHWGTRWALDLRVYRAAGHSLFHHGQPYASLFTANRLPFTYPPFALVILSPLSLGSLPLIEALWWLLNAAALVATLYIVIGKALHVTGRKGLLLAAGGGAVATLALEPLRSNLDYGQINLLLMLMIVTDVTTIKGRGRGALVGLAAAIKLTPLVYLAYFVVERDRRSAYRGAATFAALTGLSWLVLPSESTRYWLHDAFSPSRTGPVGLVSNQSWNGILHRAPFQAGAPGAVFWVAASAVTVIVGVLVARSYASERRVVEALLSLALTELLVSPISWSHHWSWVAIVPVVLAARPRVDRRIAIVLVVLLLIAVAEPYWWSIHGWLGAVLDDSLTLAGASALAAMAVGIRRRRASLLPAPTARG
jgi:alpha-1,2-mannosyltransferase